MKIYNMNLFLVSMSPWPIFLSISLMTFMMNVIIFLNSGNFYFLLINFILVSMVTFLWWGDVILESMNLGFHNIYVITFYIISMMLFIISEVFFFVSFFWSFFHLMISPDIFIGSSWPMKGNFKLNYLDLPMLNSILLISSGCSLTWGHYKLLSGYKNSCLFSMMFTIFLGMLFLLLQLFEYKNMEFSFSDGVFGSLFFITTGFHGIHVMIGISFLIFMTMRIKNNNFSKFHMLGFEFSIWYWHFVDVVWLYLYMLVYWIGS